jgi:hypothetical protein
MHTGHSQDRPSTRPRCHIVNAAHAIFAVACHYRSGSLDRASAAPLDKGLRRGDRRGWQRGCLLVRHGRCCDVRNESVGVGKRVESITAVRRKYGPPVLLLDASIPLFDRFRLILFPLRSSTCLPGAVSRPLVHLRHCDDFRNSSQGKTVKLSKVAGEGGRGGGGKGCGCSCQTALVASTVVCPSAVALACAVLWRLLPPLLLPPVRLLSSCSPSPLRPTKRRVRRR